MAYTFYSSTNVYNYLWCFSVSIASANLNIYGRGCACSRTRLYSDTLTTNRWTEWPVFVYFFSHSHDNASITNITTLLSGIYSIANEQFWEHGFGFYFIPVSLSPNSPNFTLYSIRNQLNVMGTQSHRCCTGFWTENSLNCKWFQLNSKHKKPRKFNTVACDHTVCHIFGFLN